jgi:hypothetical protein
MKIKKFNESVFNNIVEQRIDECIKMIGDSFNLEVKDKDSAKQDLMAFIEKCYTKRNDSTNNGEFNGEFKF